MLKSQTLKAKGLLLAMMVLLPRATEAGHCHPRRLSTYDIHKMHARMIHRPYPPRLTFRPRQNMPQYPYWRGKPISDSAYRKGATRIIRADKLKYPNQAWLIDAYLEKLSQIDDMDEWRAEVKRYKQYRKDFSDGYPLAGDDFQY